MTRALLLGPNGFIGSSIARQLIARGIEVTGLGRDSSPRVPGIGNWIRDDLNRLTSPAAWAPHLEGTNVVVNASGALQTGARDRLRDSQGRAIVALIDACETAGVSRFVQISAPSAALDSSTEFMRTKAQGDTRLKASTLDWTILRPGLVIGRDAFGGTALIRALAASMLPAGSETTSFLVRLDQFLQEANLSPGVLDVLIRHLNRDHPTLKRRRS